MGLFGCGPAVVALTTGLPLPIISAAIVRGGADPEAISASELASLVEDPTRDGCPGSASSTAGWPTADRAASGARSRTACG
jgi:hypothetical protein